MKRTSLVLAFLLSVFTLNIYAQGQEESDGARPRFNIRIGLGGVSSVPRVDGEQSGFAANLGGYVELPMSKNRDNWKVNLGVRFSNRNLAAMYGHEYTYNADGVSHLWHYDVRELFIEVPVVFSYDFHVSANSDFRLSFGAFYSRYVAGDVKLRETGERFNADDKIYSQVNGEYIRDAFVPWENNGGVILGLGYYFKDFYFGAEYEMTYAAWDSNNFGCGLYATMGYRF